MAGARARGVPARIAVAAALGLAVVAGACRGAEERARDRRLGDADLRVMIDTLLPAIAEASGLVVLEPVAFEIESPDRVRAYIEARLDDEMPAAEFEGMERSYRAFGLLPDDLDLHALLLDLYTEQVIGYYDPRLRRLVVVEDVRREDAAPVVAHELVHALQDQHANLDSLVGRERGNDRQAAAQAAAEGQATLVMIALEAARTTGRPIDPGALPDLAPLLAPALEAEHDAYPVFRSAPRIIRETLIFPYLGGAAFVQALYRARDPGDPPPVPFGDLLPQSTRQAMSPAEHFTRQRTHPVEIRLDDPPPGWRVVYENTLGQLEVAILLAEHLGDPARTAANGWRGDRYALLDGPTATDVLVWYSAWDDAAAADRFADAARRALGQRHARDATVTRPGRDGHHIVRLIGLPAGTDLDDVPVPGIRMMEEVPEM